MSDRQFDAMQTAFVGTGDTERRSRGEDARRAAR